MLVEASFRPRARTGLRSKIDPPNRPHALRAHPGSSRDADPVREQLHVLAPIVATPPYEEAYAAHLRPKENTHGLEMSPAKNRPEKVERCKHTRYCGGSHSLSARTEGQQPVDRVADTVVDGNEWSAFCSGDGIFTAPNANEQQQHGLRYLLLLVAAADGKHLARQSAGWPVPLVGSRTIVGTGVGVVPRARARACLVRPHEISDFPFFIGNACCQCLGARGTQCFE